MAGKCNVLILTHAKDGRCSPENTRPEGYSVLVEQIVKNKLNCNVFKAYLLPNDHKEDFRSFYNKKFNVVITAIEFTPLTKDIIDSLHKFVRNGGGLLIFHDAGDGYTNINDLSKKFDIEFHNDFFGCREDKAKYNVYRMEEYYKELERHNKISDFEKNIHTVYIPEPWKKRFKVHISIIGDDILYWGCTLENKGDKAGIEERGEDFHMSLRDNPIYDGYRANPSEFAISKPIILIGKKYGKGKVVCFGGKFVFENASLCIPSHIKLFEKIFEWTKSEEPVELPMPSISTRIRLWHEKHATEINYLLMILAIILSLLTLMK